MTEQKGLSREDFETFYEVTHKDEYGFGGNSVRKVAVTEETDVEIIGHIFSPFQDRPGSKVTIRKENVAGWEEKEWVLDGMLGEDEVPSMWVSEIREQYMNDRISEERMNELLENAKDIESATVSDDEDEDDSSRKASVELLTGLCIVAYMLTFAALEVLQVPFILGLAILLVVGSSGLILLAWALGVL